MSILDANLVVSDAQAITTTAISTNVINLGATGIVPREGSVIARNLGAGVPLPILAQVVETFATLTSLTVTLETSDSADLSASTVLATTVAIPAASLVAGFNLGGALRYMPSAEIKTYLGMRYTVVGTTATAGKMTVAIGSTEAAG